MTEYSISTAGKKFAIPERSAYAAEFERVSSSAEAARN
jgi:hypothetical protein